MTELIPWSWHTRPLEYAQRCAHCDRPLREHAAGGVVNWRDGRRYAVACLLDYLSETRPATPASGALSP